MRIVLKISGESLKGDNNIDSNSLSKVFEEIKNIKEGNELIVIVGGGNFWRGRNDLDINSSTSDYIGMLATVMNSIALNSYLNEKGVSSVCFGSFDVPGVIKKADYNKVMSCLKDGKVVIFGGGLGVVNLSTDMTTVSKAFEYNSDAIFMAKNIDGVYDKDPNKYSDAIKIDKLSHKELLDNSLNQGGLTILDIEALAALYKNNIPVYIYKSGCGYNSDNIINGDIGTKIITE